MVLKYKNIFSRISTFMIIVSLSLFADGTQTFSKELVGATTRNVGEVITYDLKSACNSLTGDCGSLVITDTLPLGMVIESCTVPTGFTINQCTVGDRDIEIEKDTPFEGGDSFSLQIKALILLSADTTIDITNEATSVIGAPSETDNETITSTADTIDVKERLPNWSVYKKRTSPSESLKPTWDTDVAYELKFCSNSAIGNDSLKDVVMEDVFPSNVTVVNDGGGTLSNGNRLTWNLGDIDLESLYLNKSYATRQCIVKNYTLLYPDANFDENDSIPNTVTVTATTVEGDIAINPSDTLDDEIGIPTPGATLSKSADDVLPNDDLNWALSANIDTSNAPVSDLVVYETFSTKVAGVNAKSVSSGQWNSPATTNEVNGSDVQADILVATDSPNDCANATYTTLSGGFIASPTTPIVYSLDLNTTCVKWVFEDKGADGPAVPRGWEFTTAPRVIEDTTGYGGVFPVEVENCVHASFTKFNGSTGTTTPMCGTANIEEATPELIVDKRVSNTSLNPGDETQYTLRFRHDRADSTGATENPIIQDLLPDIMEFVSWDAVTGLGGQPEPNLEVIDDYQGTGRTLLRFSWADTSPVDSVKLDGTAGVDNPASFSETTDLSIKFTVRVKAGTLAGTYSNSMQFFDNSFRNSCDTDGSSGTVGVVDSNDSDGDGDTTEIICKDSASLVVLQAAVLGGKKWIKGDENLTFVDATNPTTVNNGLCPNYKGFTRYPCVAQTTRGGSFEYLFRLQNVGNEPLKDYIFYDVLPYINDTGVGEPLASESRATTWTPYATSLVTPNNQTAIDAMAQTGSVIEYSTASNPCRNEVSASADETGWQPSCTDDWGNPPVDLSKITAFRIKIPFDTTSWAPIDEMEFKMSMQSPTNALVSDITDASKFFPAWNSFAHRVTQASNGSRLPTAEPKRVGIVVPKGPSVALGSAIWEDKNNNGLQDSDEGLVTASTKFELFDSEGRVVTDNSNRVVKPIVSSSGKYFFSNLPEGNYSVTVAPPTGYIPSTLQVALDNGVANDSNIKTDNGDGTYSSAIIELTNDSEPIELTGLDTTDDEDNSDNNNGDMTIDFGFYRGASLGDRVWYDSNANGIQDVNETGVANIIIHLYDTADNLIATTKTDSSGGYLFEGLKPNSYYVQFEIPTVYRVSPKGKGGDSTKDSNVDLSGKTDEISLVGGALDLSIDMGIYKLPSLGDTVWYDDNRDGIQESSEQGVEAVKVTLLKGDCSTVIRDTVTNSSGNYLFTELEPDDYCLAFSDLPPSYKITTKNVSGSTVVNDSDVDPITMKTVAIRLPSGANDLTWDMGIYSETLGTVGNAVWYDDDRDGVQDATEKGVEGVEVTLLKDCTTAVSSTVTDEKGVYSFRGLAPADYCVEFTDLPVGYSFVENNGSTLKTAKVTLASGEIDLTHDKGIYTETLGTIGDAVWYDDDRDGIQDPIEKGVEGVEVTLLKDCTTAVTSTVTDEKGVYSFRGLAPADYCVEFTDLPVGYSFVENNGSTIKTAKVTLASGEIDLTHDKGIYTESLGTIGDAVWYDDDRDGVQDRTEQGVEGVKVTLLKDCTTAVSSTVTDEKGVYSFRGLAPADYCVEFTDLPVGYSFVENSGSTLKTAKVTLASGEIDLTHDKGIYTESLGTIGDAVWYDDDRDGVQDRTEQGVEGVKVTLLKDCTTAVTSMVTDEKGVYSFRGLAPADYCVEFTDLPVGYSFVENNGSTIKTAKVTLASGEIDLTHDKGIYTETLGTIGDAVWYDDDRDGIQDATEKGVEGVKATLLKDCSTFVTSTVTDRDGVYIFRDILPADYCISFSDLPNAYKISDKNVRGATQNSDSDIDPITKKSDTITLTKGEHDLSWDMGIYSENLATIGDTVWYDDDQDGIQDPTEKGVNGVKAILLKDCKKTSVIATTVTDEKGVYVFRDLAPANYCVSFSDLPASYKISDKNVTGATASNNSDIDPLTKESDLFSLTEGMNYLDIDMGIYSDDKASIGDAVWYDDNRDGIQDESEKGVNGIKVKLLLDCDDSKVIKTAVTDDKGVYLFRDINPADYCLSFSDLPNAYKISPKGATGATLMSDSDVDPVTKKSVTTTITQGEHDLSWDMGIYSDEFASIGNAVWYDDDKDGIQDETEKGVNGVKVNLLKDCTTVIRSTVTDEKGTYIFRGLVPADYCLEFLELPNGYLLSPKDKGGDSEDSDVDASTNRTVITTLTQGENDMSWDMGIYSNRYAMIGNAVWYDDDRDGIQDADEKGVEAIKVSLYNSSNTLIAQTTTDQQGTYQFRNLLSGVYSIEFTELPVGYTITKKNQGSLLSDSDANPITGKTVTTQLSVGEADLSWDMGIYSNKLGTIGDAVWYDDNRDGIQDEYEHGVEAIKVNLYIDGCSKLYRETTTDRDGVYQFRDLKAGDYCVGFSDLPVGYRVSTQNSSDDTKDSDIDPKTLKSGLITLPEGVHNLTIDMGIYHNNVAIIGDAVWYDDNRNGIQDENEKGVEAVRVDLYNASNRLVSSTTTDRDGNYQFRDLVPDDYYLMLTDLPVGYEYAPKNEGNSTLKDSDVDATGRTEVTTLSSGEVDLSWDMGIFTRQQASIGNHVWYDDNRNGIQDKSESGVEAIRVILYNANNQPIASTLTDRRGIYQFRDLEAGAYHLRFSDLPVGYEITLKDATRDDFKDSDVDPVTGETVVTLLQEGINDISWDMGIFNRNRASIGDAVWYDDDRDGIQDSDEFGVDAVKVTLYDHNSKELSSTITDSRGNYKFGNLEPNDYYLRFSNLPIGYQPTLRNIGSDMKDSDVDVTTLKTEITSLVAGENDLSWDMGIINRQRASIGDTVWYDDNHNGLQDPYEFGVHSVKVTLYREDNSKVAETLTDERGNYAFRNLSVGGYYLLFSDLPAGYQVTSQDMGEDKKDSDVDITTFKTGIITVEAGQNDLSWDMGIFNKAKASLGNKVWYDQNHDGLQDINETGVSAVKITLYNKNREVVRTTRTNQYGEYIFRDLVPSVYYVGFSEFPAGYMITKQNRGESDTLDSDANYHRGETTLTTLDSGENDLSWDVGLYVPTLKAIDGRIWNDKNRDGLQDSDEEGIANIKVTLVKNDVPQTSSEQITSSTTSVISDEQGYYRFENIEVGEPHSYHLVFDNRTLPQDYSFTVQDMGSDDSIDSDVNPNTGETAHVVLREGVNLTYDAGIQTLRVVDDAVIANSEGPTTVIPILNNDGGNINDETILLVNEVEGAVLYNNGTAVAGTSLNTSTRYVVEGEGIWEVQNDGTVTFTAENGFDGIPTPIYYIVEGVSGNQSNIAQIKITTPCTCDPYVEDNVSTLNLSSILFMLFAISLLGFILSRREFEAQV